MDKKVLGIIIVTLSGGMVVVWSYLLYTNLFAPKTEISQASEDLNVQVITTTFPPPPVELTAQVTNCKSEPAIIETQLNQFITLQNNDTKEHIIKVNETHNYTLPSLGQAHIFMNFNNETGTFPFTCDEVSGGSFTIIQ